MIFMTIHTHTHTHTDAIFIESDFLVETNWRK